jgi:hypothetical protein
VVIFNFQAVCQILAVETAEDKGNLPKQDHEPHKMSLLNGTHVGRVRWSEGKRHFLLTN